MKKKLLIAISILLALALLGGAIYYFAVVLPDQREHAARLQAAQDYYDQKLVSYAAENTQYAPHEVDVVFLGDSLTDGYDVQNWYPQYLVLNRGIGGDTTFGLEQRLQVSVYDVQPKVVVMLIGANNMETMFDNYERILQGFRDHLPNTKVVLLSLTSMGQDWGRKNHLAAYNNVKIQLLAKKYGYIYVDLYSALLDPETDQIRPEYTTDGGHQTQAGYQVFTDTITPVLDQLLADTADAQ